MNLERTGVLIATDVLSTKSSTQRAILGAHWGAAYLPSSAGDCDHKKHGTLKILAHF